MTNWRCLFGHANGAPFSYEPGTWNVKCTECGHVSLGVSIPGTVATGTKHQPDDRRYRLIPRLRDLQHWAELYDTRKQAS